MAMLSRKKKQQRSRRPQLSHLATELPSLTSATQHVERLLRGESAETRDVPVSHRDAADHSFFVQFRPGGGVRLALVAAADLVEWRCEVRGCEVEVRVTAAQGTDNIHIPGTYELASPEEALAQAVEMYNAILAFNTVVSQSSTVDPEQPMVGGDGVSVSPFPDVVPPVENWSFDWTPSDPAATFTGSPFEVLSQPSALPAPEPSSPATECEPVTDSEPDEPLMLSPDQPWDGAWYRVEWTSRRPLYVNPSLGEVRWRRPFEKGVQIHNLARGHVVDCPLMWTLTQEDLFFLCARNRPVRDLLRFVHQRSLCADPSHTEEWEKQLDLDLLMDNPPCSTLVDLMERVFSTLGRAAPLRYMAEQISYSSPAVIELLKEQARQQRLQVVLGLADPNSTLHTSFASHALFDRNLFFTIFSLATPTRRDLPVSRNQVVTISDEVFGLSCPVANIAILRPTIPVHGIPDIEEVDQVVPSRAGDTAMVYLRGQSLLTPSRWVKASAITGPVHPW